VLGYLALFSIGILGFAFTALRARVPEGPGRELAILVVKLATMTVLPLLFFRVPLPSRLPALPLVAVGVALLAFQAVFGRGLKTLAALHPSPATLAWAIPACFLWLCLDVGVTEEGLFRAVLQTRLAGALRSEGAAIFAAALLFGLAHAPGLYLRGAYAMEGLSAPPTLGWAVAYSIAVISPAGFVFGVLWSRTRSFPLIVALHALTDLLPQLAPFLRTFSR
jgi:membrane protease YdiL (CAAX protease family)